MFTIPKISLGSSAHKRYTHDMSFDNNTTFDFGSVQPIFNQFMMAGDKLHISAKQLVRLAPMPVPSFARVKLVNECVFVPVSDVCPYFDCFQAGISYSVGSNNYLPTEIPHTTNAVLLAELLCDWSDFTIYKKTTGTMYVEQSSIPSDLATAFWATLFHGSSSYVSAPVPLSTNMVVGDNNRIEIDGADHIVDTGTYILAFRFSATGKRLRKIYLGLGYSLDATNDSVSLLPLLAFYKAWYDLYAPQRVSNWTRTKAFALIKYIEDQYKPDFTDNLYKALRSDTQFSLFEEFLGELSDCWFVSKDDFLSIHRASPSLAEGAFPFVDSRTRLDSVDPSTYSNALQTATDPSGKGSFMPSIVPPASGITQLSLDVLRRLSRYINKDSIIGRNLSNWLRVHYGSDVVNTVFKNSYHVGSSRLDLQINDVFSTSDTYIPDPSSKSSTGELLGSYGGKGIGFDTSEFSFTADKVGYVFILSSIVPTSGYFSGVDTSLLAWRHYDFPMPEYDALGYEVTPRSAVVSSNDITTTGDESNKGFGFVPRYSGFKVKRNIVNGDMSRRGTIDDMSPYYLDRILISHVLHGVAGASPGAYDIKGTYKALPSASTEWRYLCKYPWLGNFNRLFYDMDALANKASTAADINSINNQPDNFICQTIFDSKLTTFLKPLSESFDTFDDSDNTSTNVDAE